MLKINRVRVEIKTTNGIYGIDETFQPGLNFIASNDNTKGKSSVLAAIYYCLGLEQILGGVGGIGPKVLTAAYKTDLEDGEQQYKVLESGAYLEINNGIETITIYRTITHESKDPHLLTVYFGDYSAIGDPKTQSLDYYVHTPNSATNERGFHTYLASFLHLDIPIVSGSDGNERKLYLQVIFSAMFIEQKHGWASILSGMPVFGIRESKKRVIEFLLNLDTLRTERERSQLKDIKAQLENEWEKLILTARQQCTYDGCTLLNLPAKPRILTANDRSRITVLTPENAEITEAILQLQTEYKEITALKPRVVDNFDELNTEFNEVQAQINKLTQHRATLEYNLSNEKHTIDRLNNNLRIVLSDIQNNTDAARLQKFGSDESTTASVNICPLCNQKIQDNILHLEANGLFMSIDENITHLKEQKKLLEFSLHSHQETKASIERELQSLDTSLLTLRRLAHALRSDLYSTTDPDSSEAIMLKKIEISRKIEQYGKLQDAVDQFIKKLQELSDQWSQYLARKQCLPASGTTDNDNEKIQALKTVFIDNLKKYNYSSITDFQRIDISQESLLPTIDGFDMKFDSSASDGIRLIWAFTMALLQVSSQKEGNHPGILIIDEPAQQSIIPNDIDSFIASLTKLPTNSQALMAITLNSQELQDIVASLDITTYHQVSIIDKAFKKFAAEPVSNIKYDSSDDEEE